MTTGLQNPAEIARRRTVQEEPLDTNFGGDISSSLVIMLAGVADDIQPWGTVPVSRDQQLRAFWPTEPTLASTIYTTVGRNAAFNWELEGPPKTVEATQRILVEGAELGDGWVPFMEKIGIDLLTQDNGAFIEVIRVADRPDAPVIGLAHLDAGRCTRTGRFDFPVVYVDRRSIRHKLAWYQVCMLAEFPSPIETMNGMQLCAVSRVLRIAQFLKDIGVYQREKVGGKNPTSIHMVGNVGRQQMEDGIKQHTEHQVEQGIIRYFKPVILTGLDPTKPVSHVEVPIMSLPDGFNFDELMKWYISTLANGFGLDYQDLAPLPGSGLGSGQQSLILHQKSRGRGPALFMKLIEHKFNFQGIIPRGVTFRYKEQDVPAEVEQAELDKTRAETAKIYLDTGTWTRQSVLQMQLDRGDITKEEYDEMSEEPDITPEVTAEDDEPVENKGRPSRSRGVHPPKRGVKLDQVSDFEEEERLAVEASLDKSMATGLSKMFSRLKKDIRGSKMRLLRGRKQGPQDAINDPEFWPAFRVEMVTRMLPHVREGVTEAATFNANLGLAIDMDLINQSVLDFSATYTNEWWNRLEQTTRTALQKAVTNWQTGGLGDAGLPDLIKAIEPQFGAARAKRIAVTEVTRIFDEGNRIAHKAAGIETEEWQTARDELVDDICAPLDGQHFPIDGGPRPVTDTHVNCRCARLPVTDAGVTLGG